MGQTTIYIDEENVRKVIPLLEKALESLIEKYFEELLRCETEIMKRQHELYELPE